MSWLRQARLARRSPLNWAFRRPRCTTGAAPTAELVSVLRSEGWKDWHLLTAIANIVVNDRARQLGLNMSSDMNQADRERFWDLTTAEETTTDQQPVPELFTAENLRFHLFAAAVAALHRFDLELHVANVDPDDLLRMLGARFNYWTDDVAHDPIFDWN